MSAKVAPSLETLRTRYLEQGRPMSAAVRSDLQQDRRVGVQTILAELDRRRRATRKESARLCRLRRYENPLWAQGTLLIAGVDEAGMSPLAGPVVASAAILPVGYRRAGIDDSKKLSAERREELAQHLKREAVAWAIGMVEPEEIDRINIYHAGLLAMRRAVEGLGTAPEHLLIDARKLRDLAIPQQSIVRGDTLSISIAAASILAKTTRDALMTDLDQRYPGYGLARHKGYPVAEHVQAIAAHGVLPIHRRSFAPVRRFL